MISRVRKLLFPDFLAVVDYSLSLNQEGISEDGEPISTFTHEGKCIFSEKSKRIIDSQGEKINLLGKVIIKGDIAPELKTVCNGNIIINGREYEIYAGYRPRNPDGSIYSTEFEVM